MSDQILVRGLRLWAHVGVLNHERELGQWFEVDLTLSVDLSAAARSDGLSDTLDYSELIVALQQQARVIRCQTLEHYSERMLDLAEMHYGPVPIALELRKCNAPVPGFGGVVAVRRQRFTAAAANPCGHESRVQNQGAAGPSS
ncbi:MAG: dihydroneopterin aldolase [Cyanobacteriota bacterium]|jgi:dihydroneopterin aldolase